MKNTLRAAVAYGLYPLLLGSTLAFAAAAIAQGWDLKRALFHYLAALLLALIACERLFPLDPAWGMTARSFLRDLRYLPWDGAVIGGTRAAAGWLALRLAASHPGPLAHAPVWPAVAVALLAWDFAQYHLHRYSHEGTDPLARFLWRAHLAHHLPDRVYVVMHGVFHPLNAFLNAALLQGVFLGLGLSPQAAFAAMLLIDLQTMVSHFNVDVRAGWLNYLFIGTETHRAHHGDEPAEAKNYGSVVSLWDLLFGTFRYAPGRRPARLGVKPAAGLPRSEEVLRVLAHPFRPAPRAGIAGRPALGAGALKAGPAASPSDRTTP
jgi:sterol desaturase/sphingolipid hydroxylase (fatty acid hydroxylase superfamily)